MIPKSRIAAIAVTLAALGMAMWPALGSEPAHFNSQVGLTALTVVILAWTMAFGAENLTELRRARLAEFEPVLSPFISPDVYFVQDYELLCKVSNVGKGAATECQGRLWLPEHPDRHAWFSQPFAIQDLIEPGEKVELTLPLSHKRFWFDYYLTGAVQRAVLLGYADLVVELRCVDAAGKNHVYRTPYALLEDPDTHQQRLSRLPHESTPRLREDTPRIALLKRQLESFVGGAAGLPPWQLKKRGEMFVLEVTTPKGLFEHHSPVSQSTYELGHQFHNDLLKHSEEDNGKQA